MTHIENPESKQTLFYKLLCANMKRDKIAVHYYEKKYTYNDILQMTSRFGAFLHKSGLKRNDRIILALFDSIEFIVAVLTCFRLGIIAGLVDPSIKPNEYNLIHKQISPKLLLTSAEVHKRLNKNGIVSITNEKSTDGFFSLLNDQEKIDHIEITRSDEPALILFTSGSTGVPKGVLHSYGNLAVDAFPRTVLKMTENDRIFSCSRMFTSYGLGCSLLGVFNTGASVILAKNNPNPFSLQKILQQKPTIFFAVPSMYEMMLNYESSLKDLLLTVRMFITSGEKLLKSTFDLWYKIYKKKLIDVYGSSEVNHTYIANIPGHERADTCGKVVEGFSIKFDKKGQLYCKGPSKFLGYYNKGISAAEKIKNGWLCTGDIGKIDGDGYVTIKSRKDFMVKIHGKWVALLGIEEKIRECGIVKDIIVIEKNRNLEYYIKLNQEMEYEDVVKEVRAFSAENLKLHELPKEIHILDQIPRTATGKKDRKSLMP